MKFTATIFALAIAPVTLCLATNLVPNGGFEEGSDEGPIGWKLVTAGTQKVGKAESYVTSGQIGQDVAEGACAIKMQAPSAAVDGRRPRLVWVSRTSENVGQPPIPAVPGEYRLSFQIKRENFGDPALSVGAECKAWPQGAMSDGSRYTSLAASPKLTGDSGWQKEELLFTVPADAGHEQLQIVFRLYLSDTPAQSGQEPVVYLDDVQLQKLD